MQHFSLHCMFSLRSLGLKVGAPTEGIQDCWRLGTGGAAIITDIMSHIPSVAMLSYTPSIYLKMILVSIQV